MVCKKCGAETLDGALFCGSCGTRLDGKKPCTACKQLNDENNAYCVFCGARIDGKRVCAHCGTAYEGKFCPGCGYGGEKVKSENPIIAPLGKDEGNGKKWEWKRILNFSASCVGILGVLLALIFTFFIGVKVDGPAMDLLGLDVEENLYYFFGDFFKDAKALDSSTALGAGMTRITAYTYGISGLVIGVVTIVLVVTFAAMAIVRFVVGLMGATNKSADKWSILTMCTFFFGTGAFYALHKLAITARVEGVSVSIRVALNGSASAGVILCAILLGLLVVCKLIAKGKTLFNTKEIVKLVIGVVGVALGAVVFICIKNSGVLHTISSTVIGGSGDSGEIVGGFNPFLNGYGVPFLIELARGAYEAGVDVFSEFDTAVVCGNVAQALLIAALLCAAFALCVKLTAVTDENARSGMGWAISTFALLVVALVFALISVNAMKTVYEASLVIGEVNLEEALASVVEFKTTGIIVALVFAALLLGLSIVQFVLRRVQKRREAVEQPYQY